ncbi:MAG: hypothetical protein JSS23_12290 [Proteobacteria bacterium]|nr:hypothetical protein [Pseudomonadota bacterium]
MADYALPSSRSTSWAAGTYTGVIGGIAQYRPGGSNQRTTLIDVTQSPYNADNTGVTSAHSAIQSAINAASAGQVVYLPAGTYRLTSGFDFGGLGGKKNITLRGAGIGVTTLVFDGNVRIAVGTGADYQWNYPASGNTITAGLTQGSTSLTIADTSAFSTGKILNIAFENQTDNTAIAAGGVPVLSVSGYSNMRRQKSRLVSKDSSTLTISPPIYHAPQSGLSARVVTANYNGEGVGLEDFSVNLDDGTNAIPIAFEQCYNCWAYRIKSTNTPNYHIYISDSLNCEVRQCWLDGRQVGGSNGAALLMGASSGCLIEHNVLARTPPCTEINSACCGNVFRYNVVEDGAGTASMNTNHGPHNSHNLYEGNIVTGQQSDGYFGSCSDDTWLRNWMVGQLYNHTSNRHAFVFNRLNRNHSLIGNVIGWSGYQTGQVSCGNPNMGNGAYTGTAEPTTGDFWNDWKATATLTTRTNDTDGTITLASGSAFTGQLMSIWWDSHSKMMQFTAGTVTGSAVPFTGATGYGVVLPAASTTVEVFFGPGGYQELDLDVENSLLRKGNYVAQSAGGGEIPAGESLGSDTLPNSWSGGQPYDWPSGFTYPPFDPSNAATSQNYTRLPAGSWFVNGYWPGEGSPTEAGGKPYAPTNLEYVP